MMMAAKKTPVRATSRRRPVRRRKKTAPASVGLSPEETREVRDAAAERRTAITGARRCASSYLRSFVVARVNPIRFSTSTEFDFDDVLDRMRRAAAKFRIDRVKQEDVVRAGGAPADEDE